MSINRLPEHGSLLKVDQGDILSHLLGEGKFLDQANKHLKTTKCLLITHDDDDFRHSKFYIEISLSGDVGQYGDDDVKLLEGMIGDLKETEWYKRNIENSSVSGKEVSGSPASTGQGPKPSVRGFGVPGSPASTGQGVDAREVDEEQYRQLNDRIEEAKKILIEAETENSNEKKEQAKGMFNKILDDVRRDGKHNPLIIGIPNRIRTYIKRCETRGGGKKRKSSKKKKSHIKKKSHRKKKSHKRRRR